MLIHLFYKDSQHSFEDMVVPDICDEVLETNFHTYKEAAEQLFDQLEGHWCVAFCKALRDKCDELIKEHEEKIKEIDNLRNKVNENSGNE